MEELDVMSKLSNVFGSLMQPNKDGAYIEKINKHKQWLATIRHEHPSPHKKYKIGVYIRYFNQTKYDDYLKYHMLLHYAPSVKKSRRCFRRFCQDAIKSRIRAS
jgi:hypothetical protein